MVLPARHVAAMGVSDALRGAAGSRRSPPPATPAAIVAGAGGSLGAAVLEAALGSGLFHRVRVLVDAPVKPAMQGFVPLLLTSPADASGVRGAATAFVVFDRARLAHGREDAFHRPRPDQLPALARWLHEGGVQRLLVVLPHAPALLAHALKVGLASLDEQAVAALGFEHLVFVRPAQAAPGGAGARAPLPVRVAAAMLAQLRWMIPLREQPVRPIHVARFVIEVARQLPDAAFGTRIAPPELIWHSAQDERVDLLVQEWLRSGEIPMAPPRRRVFEPSQAPRGGRR